MKKNEHDNKNIELHKRRRQMKTNRIFAPTLSFSLPPFIVTPSFLLYDTLGALYTV